MDRLDQMATLKTLEPYCQLFHSFLQILLMMAVRKIDETSQAKSRLTGVCEAVYLVYALTRLVSECTHTAFTLRYLDILVQMHLYR